MFDFTLAANLGEDTLHLGGCAYTSHILAVLTLERVLAHHNLLAVTLQSRLNHRLELLDRLIDTLELGRHLADALEQFLALVDQCVMLR